MCVRMTRNCGERKGGMQWGGVYDEVHSSLQLVAPGAGVDCVGAGAVDCVGAGVDCVGVGGAHGQARMKSQCDPSQETAACLSMPSIEV